MNTIKTSVIITGVIVGAAILLLTGLWIGRTGWGVAGYWPGSMMTGNTTYGYGMMGGGSIMNQGMMDGSRMMGGGMMGAGSNALFGVEPLTLAQTEDALTSYLAGLDNDDLAIGEIMIFANHAYAQIVEQSSGIGAMEVLVDPVTLAVTPEHGPNMMWNLKYGTMAGYGGGMMGMMGGGSGMMGTFGNVLVQPGEISAELPIKPEEAVRSAQRYLDTYFPGTVADDHADPFYGYYTLHILRDGEVVGMLSVNGYTRQVFPHTWHGDFIEMSGE